MKNEKSCGAVVFTRASGNIKYVIIESKSGIHGFPKGHVEGGETELATALREVREETGLSVCIIDGFRKELEYSFKRSGEIINKQTVYYLAEYFEQTPMAQESELNAVSLMDYEFALSMLEFEDLKTILTDAHKHITAL